MTSIIGFKDLTTYTNLHNMLIHAGWTYISRLGHTFTYRKMGRDGLFYFFKLVDESIDGIFANTAATIYICDHCGKAFNYKQEGFHDSTDGTCLCDECIC